MRAAKLMAINPGSDLLSDALLAADPQRAQAAAERLASLAANGDSAPPFDTALLSQPAPAQPAFAQAAPQLAAAAAGIDNQAAVPGKRGNPYEQFEVAMLKSFFEMMLPQKADSVFGTGFAGEVWKSMFAQSLANATSHAKITRVARDLEERARRAKS
ncbi:MAG: flagellar biosynthesis protein FlgJ [Rhodomicrobium sp.]